jgi:hypothetical protein
VKASATHPGSTPAGVTLVWIDSRGAVVVRRIERSPSFELVESAVPAHHRATGHVRHDPLVRHGGGQSQVAEEPRRLDHLARFLDAVATRLPADENLLIIGPGTVREHLAKRVTETDARHGVHRDVECLPAPPMTRRQLAARLRTAAGDEPIRQSAGRAH